MKKFYIVLMLFFSLVFFQGCGGGEKTEKGNPDAKSGAESGSNGKKGGEGARNEETDTIPVSISSPEKGDINSFLLFSSNIDTDKIVDIYPMTSGIIEKINFDEGDKVNKGSVLAVLDDREASINEQKAQITYQQQKAEFERQKEIFEKELISREEYEKLKFSLDHSRLDWEQKKLMLSYTRITSPISGLVSKRYIKTGNRINTNELAFTVVYTKEKIAVINIPEQEKDQIFINQKVIISSGEKVLNGYINRISPAIDPESGTFKTTVEISDESNSLVIGQFVNVKVIKKVHKDVILVKKDVLIFEGDRVFVFIVDNNDIASKKEVKTGFDDGFKVEITQGLEINDRLVSAGKSSLKTNSKVKIIEPII